MQTSFHPFSSVQFHFVWFNLRIIYVYVCVSASVYLYVWIIEDYLQTSTEDWQQRSVKPSQQSATSLEADVLLSFVLAFTKASCALQLE